MAVSPLDDLFLWLQSALDRSIRRFRLGARPERSRRRLLIFQIDGLSRAVLDHALAAGFLPFLKRLLARHEYRLYPMSVGIPTSTPAFQIAAMYGVRPDIPGFHYHDKRRGTDIHFPRAGHAALVEADHAGGRRGILHGGSAYGCVFTGGAENDLFSFARLKQPTGRGVLRVLSAFIVIGWVIVKSLLLTLGELFRWVGEFVADPRAGRRHWLWVLKKIGLSVWVRELFTLATARDLYGGMPAIYVNFLDYDEAAHAFGPTSRRALTSLRPVDRSLRHLWRVLRRVPEHQYDLYILSDHGQASSRPYQRLSGEAPFERVVFDELLDPARSPARNLAPEASRPVLTGAGRSGHAHGFRAHQLAGQGLVQRFVDRLDGDFGRDDREAHERDGVRVISAGPNAFVYVVDTVEPLPLQMLEARFPGLAAALSESPGVGFVLARSEAGPVCFWRGKQYQLGELEAGPFAERDDRDLVLRGLADLMAMPSAGDLVIYGTDAPEGHVSYIGEVGSHAGPSPQELHTFIITPPGVRLRVPITHPTQLYDVFIRYQAPA